MSHMEFVRAKVDGATKATAEAILESLGFLPAEAIRLFYQEIVTRNAMPFPVGPPEGGLIVPKLMPGEVYPEVFANRMPSVQSETWGPPGRGSEMLQLLIAFREKRAARKTKKAGKRAEHRARSPKSLD